MVVPAGHTGGQCDQGSWVEEKGKPRSAGQVSRATPGSKQAKLGSSSMAGCNHSLAVLRRHPGLYPLYSLVSQECSLVADPTS